MPLIITDEVNAVIIKPPVPAPNLSNNEKFITTNTCFYQAMSSLTDSNNLSPNTEGFELARICDRFNKKMHAYVGCSLIQSIIKSKLEKYPPPTLNKYAIDDKRLEQAFRKNLKDNLINNENDFSSYQITDEICQEYVTQFLAYCKNNYSHTQKTFAEWYSLTSEFLSKHQGIIAGEVAAEILTEFNLNQNEVILKNSQAENNIIEQLAIKAAFLQNKTADAYGFKAGNIWQPDQPIDNFIDLVKARGYLIATGFFAKECYTKAPIKKTINKLEIMTWPKGSFANDNSLIAHSIVVIGASKVGYDNTTQDLIYYINPAQDNSAASYPVYVISYKSFCERLCSTENKNINVLKQKGLAIEDCNYFYYHPALAPSANQAAIKSKITPSFWQAPACKKIFLTAGIVAVTATLIATQKFTLS